MLNITASFFVLSRDSLEIGEGGFFFCFQGQSPVGSLLQLPLEGLALSNRLSISPRDFQGRRPKRPFSAGYGQRPGFIVENSEFRKILPADSGAGEARGGERFLERRFRKRPHFQR